MSLKFQTLGVFRKKTFSVFSVLPWCNFFLAISTRRQGDHGVHGVYSEKSDYSDRLLATLKPETVVLIHSLR